MKISVEKSEVMVLSRKPVVCNIQVSGTPFKTNGVYFTSDGRLDTEISSRIGPAGAVMRELGRCVARKAELSRKEKLSAFQAVFVPIQIYSHEIWVMTKRIKSRVQAAEMRFLRAIAGVTRLDRVRNTAIREELRIEQLILRLEKSILCWFGHVQGYLLADWSE